MDFFSAQDNARRQSRWLLLWFALAVAAVVGCIYLLVRWMVHIQAIHAAKFHGGPAVPWWDGRLFGWVALLAGGLIIGASIYRSARLMSGGGHAVAQALGARMVARSSRQEHERQLLNVVDEMAIAAGIVPPRVYIMDREPGLNAFAAGAHVSRAAVIVTRGLLEHLDRDELQGVVAHEFGHILNGDMRLNMRLAGLLYGLLMLSMLGRMLLYSHGRRGPGGRGGGGHVVFLTMGLGLVSIGAMGLLAGKIIQAAISRQREYLADASAVQFTRYPDGLGSALRKLAAIGSKVQHPEAEEFSHMFFGAHNGKGAAAWGWMDGLFATHPPIEKRIARVNPGSNGAPRRTRAPVARNLPPVAPKTAPDELPEDPQVQAILDGMALNLAPAGAAAAPNGGMGSVTPDPLAQTRRWLHQLPPDMVGQLGQTEQARALLLALLLAAKPATRQTQLHEIARCFGAQSARECTQMHDWLASLQPHLRLPLLDMALATLGALPRAQCSHLASVCTALMRHETDLPFATNVLRSLVVHALDAHRGRLRASKSPATLRQDSAHLLAWMALAGHGDDALEARQAWQAASSALPLGLEWPFAPDVPAASLHPTPEALDQVLHHLAATRASFRKNLVQACTHAILHDGHIAPLEAELLRGVCQALESPVPPHLYYAEGRAPAPEAEPPQYQFDWKAAMEKDRMEEQRGEFRL